MEAEFDNGRAGGSPHLYDRGIGHHFFDSGVGHGLARLRYWKLSLTARRGEYPDFVGVEFFLPVLLCPPKR